MPSPLTLKDVRRLLAKVDDDLDAIREWPANRPFRDAWATSYLGKRNWLRALAARLDRAVVPGETAEAVLAETLERR